MRPFSLLASLTLFLLCLSFAGCDSSADESDLFVRATVDGQPWEGRGFAVLDSQNRLFITGERRDDPIQQIVIRIDRYIGPEVYAIDSTQGQFFIFAADTVRTRYASRGNEGGQIVVERFIPGRNSVEGVFSFEASEVDGPGTVRITDGTFLAQIRIVGAAAK